MSVLSAIALMVSGLVLIGAAGNKVPLIGSYLAKAGEWLAGFALIIGLFQDCAAAGFLCHGWAETCCGGANVSALA